MKAVYSWLVRRRWQALVLLLLLSGFSGALAAFKGRVRAGQPVPPANNPANEKAVTAPLATAVQPAVPDERGPVQVVRFSRYDVGLSPREARVRPGLVVVSLENQGGNAGGVMVAAVAGTVARPEAPVLVAPDAAQGHRRGQKKLRLEAGRYEVYAADRPEQRATLLVQN